LIFAPFVRRAHRQDVLRHSLSLCFVSLTSLAKRDMKPQLLFVNKNGPTVTPFEYKKQKKHYLLFFSLDSKANIWW
jgi:hypothetical protein